jgi:RDD family
LLAVFAVQWVYFVVLEGLTGRTPGKSALRLRVVTTTGRPIHFTDAALRNVLRAADALPTAYVTGLVSMALTRRFQRLGDLVAGTMVILEARARPAVALRLWPPASEAELLGVPEHVALDAEERAALELFLRRRGTLGGAREWELASTVAPALEERFGFRASDPVRTLALLYDAAVNAGRSEAPPSSRVPDSYRSPGELAPPSGPRREGRP